MIYIKKIVIWGHFLHSHTHSYIHNAFYIAFKHLKYDTYWFDDSSNISDFDFSNSLFISEHQVDLKIPKRIDCLYLIHFLEKDRYKDVPIECLIDLKCSFRDTGRDQNYTIKNHTDIEFYSTINDILTYYTIWATDLLPYQIQYNIDNINKILSKRENNKIYFIGTVTEPFYKVQQFCRINNIEFINYGATFNINSSLNKTIDENMEYIQKSFISPAFQRSDQLIEKYIPCRIFKNISYGRMGVTNNKVVYDLFNENIIYDNDVNKCILKAIEFENKHVDDKIKIIKNLMYFVKDNHTYINRINSLKNFINSYTKFYL